MERLREKLLNCKVIKDALQKQMMVAGIISEAFKQHKLTPVVVGGLAVEFYTLSSYLTQDIDMVIPGDAYASEIMPVLGFRKCNNAWVFEQDPTIIVDFPPSPLGGSWDKVLPVELESGEIVYMISVEDIIIDRVLAVKYWGDPEEWAQYMMAAHYDDIDWDYCLKRADDEVCLEVFNKLKVLAEKYRQAFHEK
ncbi:hypothetical protein [Sporomusa acidovorans]|uniref:UbiD family decarboxylase n=1 Tax=Sporomusa acidovorans (strain ATCC 49682 / DSM 3132 / Mol) TaxID=1123286 RepID=A0ABZ3J0P4_SPOA4|nr:hypothetical protein [Sporomusa acidovorans]OZC22806.1 hypothetical protein SPACI_11170 [Sporomusa acidovorans DSM 3132]SDE51508.1 hypothetical protein SAMN04488499_101553 [Sporomusa acidovorans]